jgi:uncharacterized phage protein gp47/JayE
MSGSLYEYVEATGVIVPDTGTLKADVQSEWTGVFGTGLQLDDSTPQGIMIAGETLARLSVVQNNAQVANQINPNQAEGVFLDAICALSGLERAPSTFTIVPNVALAGQPNIPIPAGSVAQTVNGDQFQLEATATLSSGGTATGTFIALVAGAVAGPAGTWTIVTPVIGWETATNPLVAVPGATQQSDSALRILRRQTLALQNVALLESVQSAVANLPGVIGFQALENYTGSTITVDGQTLIEHSMWICVDGGVQADIANAIFTNKCIGCNYNGAITVNITEPISGQAYAVKYDVPTSVPLLVKVTCSVGSFTGDVNAAVVQAVVDFANNAIPTLKGWSVGQSASPFEVAAGVMTECPGLYISKVELALVSGGSYSPAEIAMLIYQKATVISGDVSVVIV